MNERYAPDRLLGKKEDGGYSVILIFVLVLAILLSLYNYFFAVIRVSGSSMLDTLEDKQFVLFRTNAITVKRNDIVTLTPSGYDKTLIKRVIAVENDRLMFMYNADGNDVELYLCKNGENSYSLLDEPYIRQKMSCNAEYHDVNIAPYSENINEKPYYFFNDYAIHIPEDHFYFLGDNRNISQDSRYYGAQSVDRITGKAYKFIKRGGFFDKLLTFLYGLSNKE